MKKILYFFLIIFIFNGIVYPESKHDCYKVIEIREPSIFYQTTGKFYYDNKLLDNNEMYNIFNCMNNDKVNKLSANADTWTGITYVSGFFTAIGFWASIVTTSNDVRSTGTKAAWSITGTLFLFTMFSGTVTNYYINKAVETYNQNILNNKVSEFQNENPDKVTMSLTYKLNF